MKFAHFSHVWGKPNMTAGERYNQLWRELQLCDELGFDFSFCVEHHFRPDESWMSAPSLYAVAGGMRTKRLRVGAMGYVVPLHHPLRLVEEIAIVDQMLGGRFECGLVPGISPGYFTPFGIDYNFRKSPTFEFVSYMRAAYGDQQPFSFHGDNHRTDSALLAVQPVQHPHPPLWMMSRDPPTLEFCAQNGINTGFFISFPRAEAGPRYRKFLQDWAKAGHSRKPNIGYSTVVYVDETDQKALDVALYRASRAYEGLLPLGAPGESFESRLAKQLARFEARGEQTRAQLWALSSGVYEDLDGVLAGLGLPVGIAARTGSAVRVPRDVMHRREILRQREVLRQQAAAAHAARHRPARHRPAR
jgi:alkanesulfonate monooxygenase SsuD/methylene tetrahydromethanopterin reductase-like flavin-dependent oxidoreductase (luciferase family)